MPSALRNKLPNNHNRIRFNHRTPIPHAADLGGSARSNEEIPDFVEGAVFSGNYERFFGRGAELKAWIAGPQVFIGVNPGSSQIITTVFTGWRPNAANGLCGLDTPAPTINITFFKNGVATQTLNGISAQSELAVNTSRGLECRRVFFSSYDGNATRPTPGTYGATVTNALGTNSATLNLGACTNPSIYGTTPMYMTYNASATDRFYTISASTADLTTSQLGFTAKTTVFRVPSFNESIITTPLQRFYGGTPFTDHWYRASIFDSPPQPSYVSEGNEGYVFFNQVLGTVPLYRARILRAATTAGSDLETILQTGSQQPSGAVLGFGVIGYVCP
jgi:hypothetical protein